MSIHPRANATQTEAWCEQQWIQDSGALLGGSNDGRLALLKQWRSHESRCGSTAIYQGRLALIQILLQDFSGAQATLNKPLTGDPAHAYAVEAARIQLQVAQRTAEPKPITKPELQQFEAAYQGLVAKYPKWPTGYALLGGVQSLLGKHSEAVRNLDVAKQGDVYQLGGVYRNLTVSLAAMREWEQALKAADRAFELNKTLTSDAQFAYALANADSALGQLEDAKTVLEVILAKKPEVRNDPEFLEAVNFYKHQRERAGRR